MSHRIRRPHRLVALALMLCLLASGSALAGGVEAVSGTWIDVRSADEYADGHVSFAINVPHEQITAGVTQLGLDPDEPIYLYCGSGRRAGIARDALVSAGFTRVVNLGGLDDARARAGEDADASDAD